ncbi:MAG: hypothetical protein WEC82_06045, partial [Xanthobacteraceae bacterium]
MASANPAMNETAPAGTPVRSYRFALLAASVALAAALGAVLGSLGTLTLAGAPEAETAVQKLSLNATLEQVSAELTALKASIEQAKLAALTDTVARLEKHMAAAPAQDVTGSVPSAKDTTKRPVLEGWVVRDVQHGRALVENRYGLFEVAPGTVISGIGRVEAIVRQNGRWVVVTPRGLIASMR